jgi:hypothetical protein
MPASRRSGRFVRSIGHPNARTPTKPLYYGAARVIWALHHLERSCCAAFGRDYRPALENLAERDRTDWVRLKGQPERGYMLGAAGIHMLH